MTNSEQQPGSSRGGSGLGWFWIGAGIGFTLSAVAVIAALELTHGRRRSGTGTGYHQDEIDLVEDLSDAVYEGLNVLSHAAGAITGSFRDASRERIRFGLDPTGAGAGSHAWYTGEEE